MQPPSVEESNRTLLANSFVAWREGTGSPFDLLAEDVNWTITGNCLAARSYASREAFMSQVIRPFNARLHSRLVSVVRHIYAEDDTVIAFFDASGMARDGQTHATLTNGSWRWRRADRSGPRVLR